MKKENQALPKNKNNGSKPVQEDLPSSQQQPMGDSDDIKKNKRHDSDEDDNDTNSVGIKKNGKSSPIK